MKRRERMIPVRLTEVPVMVRLAAARSLMRHNADEELLVAAFAPSDRVYWVRESARLFLDEVAA